ncbi:hypothetical protein ACFX2I_029414 [Malus domestica]
MKLREEMVTAMKALFDLPEETKHKHKIFKPYQSYEGRSPVIPLNESFGIDDACRLDAAQAFTNLIVENNGGGEDIARSREEERAETTVLSE